MAEMAGAKYLCSHLVTLVRGGISITANLEEIWPEGAVVEADTNSETGERIEIRSAEYALGGRVIQTERHQFGCRIVIEFERPWSADEFRPDHLLDLGALRNRC